MPAKADKSNGKVIAICSAVGGTVSIGTFVLGYGIRAMRVPTPDAKAAE